MKALIVEDDFTSRLVLQEILKNYATVHVAVNGREAVEAVRAALMSEEPYDLVYMDIMMPEIDGQTALKQIREMEKKIGISGPNRVKVVMTTALGDKDNVMNAIRKQCDGYMIKPYNKATLLDHLRGFGLIK